MARFSLSNASLNFIIAVVLINTLLNVTLLVAQIEPNSNSNDANENEPLHGNGTTERALDLNILNTNLDVLYLVPHELDDIFTLNEKDTFGSNYEKGWILPSEERITINLYLYYEGLDERRLNLFFNQGKFFNNFVFKRRI